MRAVLIALVALAAVAHGQFVNTMRIPDEAADWAVMNMNPAAKKDDPAVCISTNFKRCQSEFDNILGFDTSLDWKNSFDLSQAINDYADQSIDNILNLCYARSYFYQCLGAQYASCVSLYNLLGEDGSTASQAYNYVQTYMSLDFLCNAGFEEALNQFQCMKYVPQGSPDYNACVNNFSYQLGQNPQQFCGHVNDTALCLNNAYSKGCSATDPRGAGWFGCENFRRSFEATCYETTRCFVQ
ncbi:hypothetical protein PRIPAC_77088 [Pristionchus pacificus]|uniref:Uncharacterized protein n=1 Tax=Pristionchus pacificus TaxID=54126 RepID=A0A454XTZ9_PRIPA|nr:hypothetical protein PRIPAC_77088 [Pristionchus pacificus]|eukprot:PDM78912.1 hypothetical protein PRIPAC_31491 [Pristionchus pacificus]